jgi:hypothetical protein
VAPIIAEDKRWLPFGDRALGAVGIWRRVGHSLRSIQMSDELKVATTATNEAEAEMICNRLLAEGIHAISQRTIGGPEWGWSGARAVFVNARDLDRARALLEADEGEFSEDELARLSEEAGREATEG